MEINKVYNMDGLEGMKKLDDKSIDLIVIDPPYFLPVTHYQTRTKHIRNFADLGILEHFFKDAFKEMVRVIKPTGRMYIFCDGQSYPLFYYHLYPHCKSVRPLIWDKKTSINGYSWRHQHEIIIFAEMHEVVKCPSGDGDIIKCSAVKVDKRLHPAEKPVELLKKFIEKSSKEGDTILDWCFGSGSVPLVCKQLNRIFIGYEKSKEYFDIANKRLNENTRGTLLSIN